ncbi:asparaginase [uncultured Psychrosphaera sp.]|uniref:asparaginase n=1 Tax=uncultured Psychrosphaera sp. TaxID=1403522 RepID=UPI0026061A9D|nr:asparaginase [uncultured Psychrosphaera sp.]
MTSDKKRIYIAYTGGTIGMKKSTNGYIPVEGYITDVLNSMTELNRPEMPEFTISEFSPVLDSSNMSPNDWQNIANDIYKNYDDYDGFVVLHGTDTMAYTASALSFMFDHLNKPVIVTGSQIPLSEIRSDGLHNLLNALYIAANYPISEVGLFFNNRLYRGNRATKADADGFNAFDSPNYPALINAGIQIDMSSTALNAHKEFKNINNSFNVLNITDQPIGVVSLYPGISHLVIKNILAQPVNALIIQSYGVGNAPENKALLNEIKDANDRGILVVNRTQCHRGSVDMAGYATGRALQEAGVLSAYDMTLEACLTKIHHLLSQDLPFDTVRELFSQNLKGEMTTNLP